MRRGRRRVTASVRCAHGRHHHHSEAALFRSDRRPCEAGGIPRDQALLDQALQARSSTLQARAAQRHEPTRPGGYGPHRPNHSETGLGPALGDLRAQDRTRLARRALGPAETATSIVVRQRESRLLIRFCSALTTRFHPSKLASQYCPACSPRQPQGSGSTSLVTTVSH
jgi:hypothetical protein